MTGNAVRLLLSLLCNAAIVICTARSVVRAMLRPPEQAQAQTGETQPAEQGNKQANARAAGQVATEIAMQAAVNAATQTAEQASAHASPRPAPSSAHSSRVYYDTFRYFTTDSNVLCALAALLLLPFCAVGLLSGRFSPPLWALLLKYVGTVAVAVTFLTVMAFLGPTQGYRAMLDGDGLYLHLIGPLLALLSFCLLETGARLTWAQAALGALPTLVYGAAYLAMVVLRGEDRGGWEDFYGFNQSGRWKISLAMMLAGTLVICAVVALVHNAM